MTTPAHPPTLQSDAPLSRIPHSDGREQAVLLVRQSSLLLDPPYQRGAVWGLRRRRNLIRSLLLGIPTGAVFLNRRPIAEDVLAVVDGKQRIETIRMFLDGELSVPASWFPADVIEAAEETGDGPYVRYPELRSQGRARFDRSSLNVQLTDLETVEEEAVLFDLINFGGLQQGEIDDDQV